MHWQRDHRQLRSGTWFVNMWLTGHHSWKDRNTKGCNDQNGLFLCSQGRVHYIETSTILVLNILSELDQ